MDLEQGLDASRFLDNTFVRDISWTGLTVAVPNTEDKGTKHILSGVDGLVEAGECCAILGPSGSGKTTLLNALARRHSKGASVTGNVAVNGAPISDASFRGVTSFIEARDYFIDALTVRETLEFASRLAGVECGRKERLDRANTLLECFGLVEQVNDVVGKSLSTGQKRRLAVAEQLVTGPKILFLDEPTSGLDSVASFHILSHLRAMAKQYNIIVICSIHQPSVTMLEQFDKLVLLSKGKTHYFGLVKDVVDYYDSIDVEVPDDVNPAEFMLSLVNVDFSGSTNLAASQRLTQLQDLWHASSNAQATRDQISASQTTSQTLSAGESLGRQTHKWKRIIPLLHRNLLKALRDNMAYKFRLVMYTGLGVLMGSIWLRLDHDQSSIQLLINAIVVACGFMAFMAVTYVPAFVEDHQQYKREHRNGLYGATLFQVSNFLTGIPFLFLFALSFSAVFYWLSNGHNSASAFMTWVMWLFLNLVAAEAVIVAVVAIVPGFTGSLVLAALINVLMFATAGTLVPPEKLNSFYKYGFYYWNFQTYVFQGMMKTQFNGLLYTCGSQCLCTYAPTTPTSCQVSGDVVLDLYGVDVDHQTRNVGFVLAIILGFRLVAWVVIKLKH